MRLLLYILCKNHPEMLCVGFTTADEESDKFNLSISLAFPVDSSLTKLDIQKALLICGSFGYKLEERIDFKSLGLGDSCVLYLEESFGSIDTKDVHVLMLLDEKE